MSLSRITSVWCDGLNMRGDRHAAGCPQWIAEAHDAAEARAEAKAYGWVRRGRYDYSPACAAALRPSDGAP